MLKSVKRCAAALLAAILLLCSCGNTDNASSDTAVAALVFCRKSDVSLIIGSGTNTDTGYVRAEMPPDTRLSNGDVVFVSDDISVAVIDTTDTSAALVAYRITAVSPGETYVYAMTSDGMITSERLKVTVSAGETDIASTEPDTAPDTLQTEYTSSESDTVTAATEPAKQTLISDAETSETTAAELLPSPQIPDGTVYSINTKSKKIHLPSCSSVGRIKPENLDTTDDPDALIADGYTYCKKCLGQSQ